MTKKDLIAEKRSAKFKVDFLKPFKSTAHTKYNNALNNYNRLKELCKLPTKELKQFI